MLPRCETPGVTTDIRLMRGVGQERITAIGLLSLSQFDLWYIIIAEIINASRCQRAGFARNTELFLRDNIRVPLTLDVALNW